MPLFNKATTESGFMNFTKASLICSQRIKHLRNTTNLSTKEFSSKLQISHTVILNCENAHKLPRINDLLKIANYFSVSIDYLLGRTDNPHIKVTLNR